MTDQAERQRDVARELYLEALQSTTVAAAVACGVRCEGRTLSVKGLDYDLSRYSEVCMVSIGKAGATLFDAVDAVLPTTLKRRAVVSAPAAPQRMSGDVRYFQGGHPEPNQESINAARAALEAVSGCAEDALVMFLISGGASAMCELPIADSVSLDDMVLLNRLLIGSGASIGELNCVRKHLSRVKGGRLALQAGAREKVTLLVSDVPENALDSLGSGPSLPDNSTIGDCLAVIERYGLRERLPASVQAMLDKGLEESPKPDHAAFRNATTSVLLGNGTFLDRTAELARMRGYGVQIDNSCDDWNYEEAAKYLLAKLESLKARGRRVCLLSGGEVTVRLPGSPGIGGRNLQFCLCCVALGLSSGTTVLSAGTDGVDGNSPAAGAVVDATTRQRGERIGLSIETHLRDFDAYNFFAPLGDAIVTGPTGNNLRDVRVLLWEDA